MVIKKRAIKTMENNFCILEGLILNIKVKIGSYNELT
jgi:hypothetical protein